MSEYKIVTSGRRYKLEFPVDHPRVWKREFDYIEEDDACYPRLVKYRGVWYDINDTMATRHSGQGCGVDAFKNWDGYIGDSFFSGVLFRFVPGTGFEEVQCATYYA